MTVQEIQAFVVSVDPNAGHYESTYRGSDAYTEWHEKSTMPLMGDGVHVGGIRFQIDRYTKDENDSVAAALFEALENRDDIAFEHIVDYEGPETGYIRHIFDCEGV